MQLFAFLPTSRTLQFFRGCFSWLNWQILPWTIKQTLGSQTDWKTTFFPSRNDWQKNSRKLQHLKWRSRSPCSSFLRACFQWVGEDYTVMAHILHLHGKDHRKLHGSTGIMFFFGKNKQHPAAPHDTKIDQKSLWSHLSNRLFQLRRFSVKWSPVRGRIFSNNTHGQFGVMELDAQERGQPWSSSSALFGVPNRLMHHGLKKSQIWATK